MAKIIKIIHKKVEDTVDITCDICGKSCRDDLGGVPLFNYAEIKGEFGYGSKLDGKLLYDKHLCEDCYIKIFGEI